MANSTVSRRILGAAGGTAVALLLPSVVLAHPGRNLQPEELWTAWTFDPWVLLGIGLAAMVYARGVSRVWSRAGPGRGVSRWQFRSFCFGLATIAIAQVTPLHALGGALFAAHMAQHEILILISAPLLILGAPQVACAWAVPRSVSTGVARALRAAPFRETWRAVSHPIGAWALHGAAVWLWHVPVFYQATLRSELAHAAQHFSFFATALLFWYVLFKLRRTPAGLGAGVLLVFTTALHNGALGALLTFAEHPWYTEYAVTAPSWGLTALEDQQLGGLIMWIPGGVIYLGAALALLGGWLRLADRQARGREEAGRSLPIG